MLFTQIPLPYLVYSHLFGILQLGCFVPDVDNGYLIGQNSARGVPTGQKVPIGTKLVLTCVNGYKVSGSEQATCETPNTWSYFGGCLEVKPQRSLPGSTGPDGENWIGTSKVQVGCRIPTINNGFFVANKIYLPPGVTVPSGQELRARCKKGFQFFNLGRPIAEVTCRGSTLVPDGVRTLICIPAVLPGTATQCRVPPIENGHLQSRDGDILSSGSQVDSGTDLVLVCQDGFSLGGSNKAVCKVGNTWSYFGGCFAQRRTTAGSTGPIDRF